MSEQERSNDAGQEVASSSTADPSTREEQEEEEEAKHPLQNEWTLWYKAPSVPGKSGKYTVKVEADWEDVLHKVFTFSSVEDFWRVFNNITPASDQPTNASYLLFKSNIQPKWEDPNFAKGGQWRYSFSSRDVDKKLNDHWLWILLALIGESFEPEDEIGGVCMSRKKAEDRIELWVRHQSGPEANAAIGERFKQVLEQSKLPAFSLFFKS